MTVKVGVVGEIFVKYSPLGNNRLEKQIMDEGAEVVVPGLFDFCLYPVYERLSSVHLYRKNTLYYPVYRLLYSILCRKKDDVSELIRENGSFRPWTSFRKITGLVDGYINKGMSMGEGWLLPAEILELADSGCKNIVCAQPFGCLPNHICAKGMMKPIKDRNPDINIVAIDYDAGASRVNQENRLKLMLFNAQRNASAAREADASREVTA